MKRIVYQTLKKWAYAEGRKPLLVRGARQVGEYRKRELDPALDLLLTANIMHKITHTSGQGLPIGSGAKLDRFKLILIDVGLTQSLLNLDLSDWFISSKAEKNYQSRSNCRSICRTRTFGLF